MKTQHEYSKEQITAMLVSHLERFAVRQKKPFTIEKARQQWMALVDDKDYPTPHSNAWGSAWRIAKNNLIARGYEAEKVSYTPAVSASTRRHPVANWTVRKVA